MAENDTPDDTADGGPAFPLLTYEEADGCGETTVHSAGLSVRALLAAHALAGLARQEGDQANPEQVAGLAVACADAVLRRLRGRVSAGPAAAGLRPDDFEPYSETDERLSEAQVRAIRNMAYYRALLMHGQGKWSPDEEAAYLNGAMVAFFACRSADNIPGSWVLGTAPLLDTLARWKADGRLAGGA